MKRFNKTIASLFSLVVLFAFLTLVSCANQYAVSLTSTENMKPGEIFKIKGKTFHKIGLKSVSFYILADGEGEFNEITSVVEVFNSQQKAKAFVKSYTPYLNSYARAKGKHIIRPKRNPQASGFYRMRDGEVVKVLSIDESPTTIDGKEGYWVEVLTSDGYRGYSFDYRLEVYHEGGNTLASDESNLSNALLLEMLEKPFYPYYYRDFINENRINLTEINENNGLRLSEEKDRLFFRTAEINLVFDVEQIKGFGKDRFASEERKLNLSVINPDYLIISFDYKEGNRSYDLCRIEELASVAQKEQEERNAFYRKLIEMGPSFTSSAYGTLTFNRDRSFIWNQFGALSPSHIPSGSGNRGFISFELHMNPTSASKYDDALTFLFNGKNSLSASFLVQLDEARKAIKLYTVPKSLINEEKLITRENPNPLVIFFRAE